ncbi:MAG: MBL fold metallo-hydrolase [Clostridia bacterium]|nr:MBL fold metallo-hydrolase [Clostridia bacterium]
MAKKKNKKRKKLKIIISTIALILIIAFVATCYFYPPFYEYILSLFNRDEDGGDIRVEGDTAYVTVLDDLQVHFVDVGQGDCIIIELPDGKNVLIDAGENKYENLKEYIDTKTDVKVFDYVIATHADSDHIGNMDKVLQDYEVKYIYRPYVLYSGDKYNFSADFNKGSSEYKQSSIAYGDLLNEINNETYTLNGETKNAGWEFFDYNSDFAGKISYNGTIYDYYFDFLTPRVDNLSSLEYNDANDYSPIIKFTYCNVDILFTGDAEKDAEADFVSYYKTLASEMDLDVDILKVGHHGSETSTTQDLLDIVKPEHSVIQCGLNNKHLHPRQSTLDRLVGIGSSIYRNDLHGDILLTITANATFTFSTEVKNPSGILIGGDA